ncbi:MAG TPA: hypothetical protein VGR10_02045 [Thermoleophilaceae bacterium]|nr:hypothetical protein [Thermoleophilaceae bacterium]
MTAQQPSPRDVVRGLEEGSSDVRAAVLLDDRGAVAAHAGADATRAGALAEHAIALLKGADAAAGPGRVDRMEVSRPDGGVFAVRAPARGWTLVVVSMAGALGSLVLYDMRMALAGLGAGR